MDLIQETLQEDRVELGVCQLLEFSLCGLEDVVAFVVGIVHALGHCWHGQGSGCLVLNQDLPNDEL